MIDIQKIQTVLARMAVLLRIGCLNDWAKALECFYVDIANDPIATSSSILATLGGAGSLNDIILYKDGQVLAKENTELDTLRTELYSLCHK